MTVPDSGYFYTAFTRSAAVFRASSFVDHRFHFFSVCLISLVIVVCLQWLPI